jgi:preprotein translocase SecE subunit
MKNPLKFIQDVKQEAFKVTWPTAKETIQGALMVFAMAVLASLFFLLLDQVLKFFFRNYSKGKYIMKNWYIVQSHSSFENKVAQLIKEEAEKAKISEKFEEIIVPTHDITEVKRGKRVQRKKK